MARVEALLSQQWSPEQVAGHPERFRTITADNGTEFHDHRSLEAATGVPFYFATPHPS